MWVAQTTNWTMLSKLSLALAVAVIGVIVVRNLYTTPEQTRLREEQRMYRQRIRKSIRTIDRQLIGSCIVEHHAPYFYYLFCYYREKKYGVKIIAGGVEISYELK